MHPLALGPLRAPTLALLLLVGLPLPSSPATPPPAPVRPPPASVTASALWPDGRSTGEPLPRAKAGCAEADAKWGSVWLPLDAIFDGESYEHTGMKMKFNSVMPARVGMPVRVAELEELWREWLRYKDNAPQSELEVIAWQAGRTGVILALDNNDQTAKVRLDPVGTGAPAAGEDDGEAVVGEAVAGEGGTEG